MSFAGYDDWKLATPPEYERDDPEDEERCDVCGGTLTDVETVVVIQGHAFCGIDCRDWWLGEQNELLAAEEL